METEARRERTCRSGPRLLHQNQRETSEDTRLTVRAPRLRDQSSVVLTSVQSVEVKRNEREGGELEPSVSSLLLRLTLDLDFPRVPRPKFL